MHVKSQLSTIAVFAIMALLVNATAMAQTKMGDRLRDKEIGGSVGLSVGIVPDYEGSDDYEAIPFPTLTFDWWGGRSFQLIGLNAKVDLLRSKTWAAGPVLNYRRGREDDVDDPIVKLMSEIDGAVELGAFSTWRRKGWSVSGMALQDISDEHEGFLLEVSGGFARPAGKNAVVSGKVSGTFASDDYMETYFGVNAADAAASGLSLHTADSGLKDVGAMFSAMYRLSPQWDLIGTMGYNRLLGDAEESPVVKDRGDEHQFIATAGFAFKFGTRVR